jgi:hypothetical protein
MTQRWWQRAVFERVSGQRRLLVALNLGADDVRLDIPGRRGIVLVSTHLDADERTFDAALTLRGNEGVVALGWDAVT